jgi:hypothetical protein
VAQTQGEVAAEPTLEQLESLAVDVHRWLEAAGVEHAFIGAFALAFAARPRATRAVDGIMIVDLDELDRLAASAPHFGLRVLLDDGIEFARTTLVLRMEQVATGITVDLSVAFTAFEQQAIREAAVLPAGAGGVPVIRPSDLIVMKAFARRPIDTGDVVSILDSHPGIDLGPVRAWLRQLGEAIGDDSVLTGFDATVAAWRREVERREGRAP